LIQPNSTKTIPQIYPSGAVGAAAGLVLGVAGAGVLLVGADVQLKLWLGCL